MHIFPLRCYWFQCATGSFAYISPPACLLPVLGLYGIYLTLSFQTLGEFESAHNRSDIHECGKILLKNLLAFQASFGGGGKILFLLELFAWIYSIRNGLSLENQFWRNILYTTYYECRPVASHRWKKRKTFTSVTHLSDHSHISCGRNLFLLCPGGCCAPISVLRVYPVTLTLHHLCYLFLQSRSS